jgi:hypothetical protein
MDKCLRYLKQWVPRSPSWKKEMNKIAHVLLQKFFKFQIREICFKEHSRIRLATIYISTHTCTSWSKSMTFFSWILVLTLQYMQYKYVLIFIPTWTPHKLLEVGKNKAKSSLPWWGSKNTTYTEWFESTTQGEGKLCFVSKNLKLFLQLTWLKEEDDLFRAIPFFNCSKLHSRHFESCIACMTGNGFMLMSCPKVMS